MKTFITTKFKPSDIKTIIKASEEHTNLLQTPASHFSVVALHDFEAMEEDEVSIKEKDVIEAIDVNNPQWLYGTNQATGDSGLFPRDFGTNEYIF